MELKLSECELDVWTHFYREKLIIQWLKEAAVLSFSRLKVFLCKSLKIAKRNL